MRDINKILNLFADEHKMNYCEDFDVIKGILEYCDENIKPLEKVQFRGGNDKIIDEIIKRIQIHFTKKAYITEEDSTPIEEHDVALQKITFFLVLNTDATYKYNLKNDQNLCHLLDILPQLPKCLLLNIIWGLKLEKYFYEIVHYCPSWFTLQFLEAAVHSLKYINGPYEVLNKVENLMKAIYGNLCRSDFREMDNVDKKIIFGKFYDYTMELLRQFYTPDAEKFKQFKKYEFFKYSGFALQHLLDMLLFCFDGYELKTEMTIDTKYEIYEICKEACPLIVGKLKENSELVQETQLKIIMSLLNSLQYNVMLVTIDVFMSWVEVDLTEELTLQACVGEKAFNVLERMANNKSLGHDVDQQLKFIAIRPKTLQDIIKEATIGDILCKLDEISEYTEKKVWFNELLSRSIAFGNDECLETIRSNIKLMNSENVCNLIDFIKLEMQNEFEENISEMEVDNPHEEIIKIVLKSLENLNIEQLLKVCLYSQKQFGQDSNLFQQPNLDERYTEFLNKFVQNFDLQQFLQFAIESPKFVWTKFFNEACNSEKQVHNFCSTVKTTLKYSNGYFEPLFSSSFATAKINEKFFPNLVVEVYYQIYFERKWEFFKSFINKNCTEILGSEQFRNLIPILKALNMIANKSNNLSGTEGLNFGEVTAPVLIMAAQIMEKCRWDLISYSDTKDEIVRNCIEFIQSVSKKFLPVATDKDKQWISKTLKKSYRPLTQYYFQKFTLSAGDNPKVFDRFLHPSKFETDADIEKFLISTYVRCTIKETEWLAKSEHLLPHISDVILLLNGIVTEMGEDGVLKHYRHCILNYINIIKKFLLPKLTNDSHVRDLGFKILNIIDSSPARIYEDIFMSFHSILLDVFRKVQPVQEDLIKDVKKFVASMVDCKAKEIFHDNFIIVAAENVC